MKVLVTGAGGYIASYLLPYLRSKKIDVYAITSKKLPHASCHAVNWRQVSELESLLKSVRPDYIYHLAGTRNLSPFSDFTAVNVQYASNLFDAMLNSRVLVPILIVGSAAEYGNVPLNEMPIREET